MEHGLKNREGKMEFINKTFGIELNNEKPYFYYPFCAIDNNNCLFITEPLIKKINVLDSNNKSVFSYNRKDWFPRWIAPKKDCFFVLDSLNKEVITFSKNTITSKKIIGVNNPLFVTCTNYDTFLIGGAGENCLAEYDEKFNLIRTIIKKAYDLHSVQLIEKNNYLVSEINKHQVYIFNDKAEIEWSYGKKNLPGEKPDELYAPKFAISNKNNIIIADGMNSRLISVNLKDNQINYIFDGKKDDPIWWPVCLQTKNDDLLITDAGNGRILLMDSQFKKINEIGHSFIKKHILKSPRSIEFDSDGNYLIADTLNNRVIKINSTFDLLWSYGNRSSKKENLFWPRSFSPIGDNYLICDARNKRILIVNKDKKIINKINFYFINSKKMKFGDPHYATILDDGNMLITDSKKGRVLIIDKNNNCIWGYGLNGELKDPHHAFMLQNKSIMICDTENNRILNINTDLSINFEMKKTSVGFLKQPRWCEENADGNYLIADSGNNRILKINSQGLVLWQFGSEWNLNDNSIRFPRCVRKINNNVVISDTYNNRIVFVNDENE